MLNRNLKDVRKFKGVKYTKAGSFDFKPDAEAYADYLRRNGIPARVIKIPATKKRKTYWKLYENYPK